MPMQGYREDLAYIHDAGFSDYCLNAAPRLLRILNRNGIKRGLAVDLGCGSGRWAHELNCAGYDVLGVDQSAAFIRMARANAPKSKFIRASLLRIKLPTCDAVTSIGECLNYCFDSRAGDDELARLFERVHAALRPGGVFIFDVAEPSRIPKGGPRRHWTEGTDWAVLVETTGDRKRSVLTRRIICFRRLGKLYRRREEDHRLILFSAAKIRGMLAAAGFRVERLQGYGSFQLPPGISAYIARKT